MNQLRQRRVWQSTLALYCIVSILLLSVATASHVHSGTATASVTQDCRFCAVGGTNGALLVALPAAVLVLCLLVVPFFQVDRPFTSHSRYLFSPRSPPLLV